MLSIGTDALGDFYSGDRLYCVTDAYMQGLEANLALCIGVSAFLVFFAMLPRWEKVRLDKEEKTDSKSGDTSPA